MTWLLSLGYFALMFWLARRARQRTDEYAAAGLFRSPLFWIAIFFLVTLAGLTVVVAHVHRQGPVPTFVLLLGWLLFAVILLLRRALKWRYPI